MGQTLRQNHQAETMREVGGGGKRGKVDQSLGRNGHNGGRESLVKGSQVQGAPSVHLAETRALCTQL